MGGCACHSGGNGSGVVEHKFHGSYLNSCIIAMVVTDERR